MAAEYARAQSFKVIAFFTGKNDQAHVSFVKEANRFFPKMAEKHHFQYDTTVSYTHLDVYKRQMFFDGVKVLFF